MEKIIEVGSITLDTEQYRLARTEDRREWQQSFEHEPPWQEGPPNLLSSPQYTWHMGGLKSQQGIEGSSEYGENTDTRFPFRLLPGPKVNVVTLTASASTPTSIFEAMGLVWVVAGRRVYTIDPSDDSVTEVLDFGSGVAGVMGLRWEDDLALVTTDEDARSLWRITIGAYQSNAHDTGAFQTGMGQARTEDVVAYRLAAGINRLYKVDKTGNLRNVVSGSDPMVEASYSDDVQMGEKDVPPTGLIAFERTALVGKAEGLFGVDEDGFGTPLIRRITRAVGNGIGMASVDPHVYFPHSRGVYRVIPGSVEVVGIEKELMNESPIKGVFKAFAPDNQWVYGALTVGSDFHILWSKDRQNEPGFGPLLWDTWVHVAGKTCEAMLPSSLNSPPRIWFGHGNDVAYIKLSTSGGAPDPDGSGYEFALAGARYSVKHRFGDWSSKDYPKVAVVGKNLTAARYWVISYSVDGGAFSDLDKDSVSMKIADNVHKTFYLPTSAVGREVQFKYTYTGDVASEGGELNFVEGFAVPQSRKVPIYTVTLYLAEDLRHDQSRGTRSAITQFNDLATLVETAAAVVGNGPWGDGNVQVRSLRLVESVQEGGNEPEFLVEAVLQRREDS